MKTKHLKIKNQKILLGLVSDHQLKFDENIDYIKKMLVDVLVLCTNRKNYYLTTWILSGVELQKRN